MSGEILKESHKNVFWRCQSQLNPPCEKDIVLALSGFGTDIHDPKVVNPTDFVYY